MKTLCMQKQRAKESVYAKFGASKVTSSSSLLIERQQLWSPFLPPSVCLIFEKCSIDYNALCRILRQSSVYKSLYILNVNNKYLPWKILFKKNKTKIMQKMARLERKSIHCPKSLICCLRVTTFTCCEKILADCESTSTWQTNTMTARN